MEAGFKFFRLMAVEPKDCSPLKFWSSSNVISVSMSLIYLFGTLGLRQEGLLVCEYIRSLPLLNTVVCL